LAIWRPPPFREPLLSRSEAWDRGGKATPHRQIASLREYAFISQHAPQIEVFTRQPDDSWTLTEAAGLHAEIRLASIDCTLSLARVYENVEFDGSGGHPPVLPRG
jgi:hypothetical protein